MMVSPLLCSHDNPTYPSAGPVIIYMAKVDDALTAVGSSASWFKVYLMHMIPDVEADKYTGG